MLPSRLADPFLWGLGIEDTFIAQPSRVGHCLDEYALTQHYEHWREDLDRIAAIGVRWMRYGIPWYRVNPEPGVFDWSWTDQVLPYLRNELGVSPIIDLVHYGCPLWLEGQASNPDYPRLVAEYAGAVADRYGDLIPAYTPLNEPLVNAMYAGKNGRWPPYLRGERGYVRVLLSIAKGISLTIEELRRRAPDATIVDVEATCSRTGNRHVAYQAPGGLAHHMLPPELVTGLVGPDHPMRAWLTAQGASDTELDWLVEHPQSFDVIGVNFYPTFGEARRIPRQGELDRISNDLVFVLRAFAQRFDRPVILTETSDIASGIERRARWLDTSVQAIARARSEGVNVVGYIWFPAYSCVDWRHRDGSRPANDYLLHMGLWELHPDKTGRLVRHETELVNAFRRLAADGLPSIEGLRGIEDGLLVRGEARL
jgi:beta-glucosidase